MNGTLEAQTRRQYNKNVPKSNCQYTIGGDGSDGLVQHYCPYAYSFHLCHHRFDRLVDPNRSHSRYAHAARMMARPPHRRTNRRHLHSRPTERKKMK